MEELVRAVVFDLDSGSTEECELRVSDAPPYRIAVDLKSLGQRSYEAGNLFDALVLLRRDLEAAKRQIICAGARVDTYPSGMARSMGSARLVYIHHLGRPATELVDIFDPSVLELVGTVQAQAQFRQDWVKSLSHRR